MQLLNMYMFLSISGCIYLTVRPANDQIFFYGVLIYKTRDLKEGVF